MRISYFKILVEPLNIVWKYIPINQLTCDISQVVYDDSAMSAIGIGFANNSSYSVFYIC